VGAAPIRCRDLLHRGIAAAVPRRWFLRDGPAGCGSVCLTFDDGPHPEHTPRLLDALAGAGVPATFFVVGRRAQQYPMLVRRIAAAGHAVGNHTFTHPVPGRVSPRQLLEEVRRTGGLLADLLGWETSLFRPPYGRISVPQLLALWRAGRTVVLWNANPKDYARGSAAEVREWFRGRPLRGGDLVLMHDDRPHAAGVVPALVASAQERGLGFTTADAWADEKRGT
jgi:peptidoglycan/xylan/chitin deacetylase (PgdA/CDA1 family)